MVKILLESCEQFENIVAKSVLNEATNRYNFGSILATGKAIYALKNWAQVRKMIRL